MNKVLLRLLICAAIVSVVTMTSFAQGRGRGVGQGRRADVFADRDFRGNRGRNQHWKKCGKFVNCHDARDGRWDGRGPRRTNGFSHNDAFGRGSNVGYRRLNTNDYWRRRHLMYGTRYGRRY